MIWYRTFALWWLAAFAVSMVWIVLSNLAGIEPYTRGYGGGALGVIGLWVAAYKAQRQADADTSEH